MSARFAGWFGGCVVALGGGAPLAEAPTDELPKTKIVKGSRQCIRLDRIRDYQFIDDHNLIVTARRRIYHMELHPTCIEPSNAFGIRFYDSGARNLKTFCAGSGYIVQDPFGREREDALPSDRCHVRSIRPLNDEQLYELYIEGGRVAPPPPLPKPELEVIPPGESQADEPVEQDGADATTGSR